MQPNSGSHERSSNLPPPPFSGSNPPRGPLGPIRGPSSLPPPFRPPPAITPQGHGLPSSRPATVQNPEIPLQQSQRLPPPNFSSPVRLPPAFPPPAFTTPKSAPPPPPQYASSYATPATPFAPPTPTFTQPPTASHAAASLVEDFESLSVQPTPGSMDPGLDINSLPRPTTSPDNPQTLGPANADPRYFRLTTNAMPNAQSLRGRWHLPLGAVVHPLAEAPPGEEVPIVNFGPSGIIRCRRCRTYINPFATFVDGGRRWKCNVCLLLNEVPAEYFCILDSSGNRTDASLRPELCRGSVEFEAPAEYMVRPPMPPSYFFLIDVSAPAAQSGMLQVMCDTIKECLDSLPGHPRTRIGFLTFDSTLHFYHLKDSLTQPQVLVVSDTDDPFLPVPDDLLVNLGDSRAVVDALLDSLPNMYQGSTCVESALGPALKAAYLIMNHLGGKLLLFQTNLPSVGAGRLRLRGEDPKLYGTEREHTLRVTEDSFYKSMAADCSRVQICVNVYAFSAQYLDLASIGTLSRYTSGQVYTYPGYQTERDGEKFSAELRRDLTRDTAWEAVVRIRCGKGLKITTYHGHFFVRSLDLLALPAVSCDQAFAIQINHEENLITSDTVYFQCALLYTSSVGVRRIRVHTLAVPVVADLGQMYKASDGAAMATVLAKIAIDKSLTGRLEDSRELIRQKLVQGLKEYRALYQAVHRTSGRLIYPEGMKLLPLLVLGLTKTAALQGGFREVRADERSLAMYELMSMSVTRTLRLLYPLLLRIDNMSKESGTHLEDGSVVLPPALPLVAAALDIRGVFLLDDGMRIWVWVGKQVAPEVSSQLLGNSSVEAGVLQRNSSALSSRVFSILDWLRKGNAIFQNVTLTGPGEPSEITFFEKLVEDRSPGSVSYLDFVVNLYRQVQQK